MKEKTSKICIIYRLTIRLYTEKTGTFCCGGWARSAPFCELMSVWEPAGQHLLAKITHSPAPHFPLIDTQSHILILWGVFSELQPIACALFFFGWGGGGVSARKPPLATMYLIDKIDYIYGTCTLL
jgi:hypothetical protein